MRSLPLMGAIALFVWFWHVAGAVTTPNAFKGGIIAMVERAR